MKKLIAILLTAGSTMSFAQLSGDQLVEKVNKRDEGQQLTQSVRITMVDKRGKTQNRTLVWYRKDYSGQRNSVIFYNSPANIKGTSFLTNDFHSPDKEDDQWLYLPALRRTRRISASNRGDYFLGTDLTYEDVKLATKIGANDYHFKLIGELIKDGHTLFQLQGFSKTTQIAKELGYSKVEYLIDKKLMMPRVIKFWDIAGNVLKTVEFKDIRLVQGIYTAHQIDAINLKSDHKTTFIFKAPDYETPLADDLFSEQAMIRGI